MAVQKIATKNDIKIRSDRTEMIIKYNEVKKKDILSKYNKLVDKE